MIRLTKKELPAFGNPERIIEKSRQAEFSSCYSVDIYRATFTSLLHAGLIDNSEYQRLCQLSKSERANALAWLGEEHYNIYLYGVFLYNRCVEACVSYLGDYCVGFEVDRIWFADMAHYRELQLIAYRTGYVLILSKPLDQF